MSTTEWPGPEEKTPSVGSNSASEPLGAELANGDGWARLEFGDQIGQDNSDNKFVAIKVLTGHATDMYENALSWEPDAFRLISRLPTSSHCAQLLDEFTIPRKDSTGPHVCFVTPVYGGDVKELVSARGTPLPLPLAKRMILHLLRGIAHLHGRGVVHTDIKHDNIFFSTTMSVNDIEEWVKREPSRRHAPQTLSGGVAQAAVSQPLPLITEDEAIQVTYLLADFGCAQPSGLHDSKTITSLPLRPQEVYLGADWDKPVDIWTFGCLVYELVTLEHLFKHQRNEKFGMDEAECMLYQMMLHTGEIFLPAQLEVSPGASEYFNADFTMKKNPNIFHWPIETQLLALGELSDEETEETAVFIERCLRLNPADRPTATELLGDPWFNGVD